MAEHLHKEKNFISAVVYLHDCADTVVPFFQQLNQRLDARFEQYELIAVNDRCADGTVDALKQWARDLTKPLTIIHMSLYQGTETAMNAGLDCSIGDYVYEFDSAEAAFPWEMVDEAYSTAMKGSDIVTVCPDRQRASSKWFYKLFNANSRSAYRLRTDVFRLVSRRAVNRVHAVSVTLPYRKAAYAASGLKMTALVYPGTAPAAADGRFGLAIDSLALYTDAGYRFSLGLTGFMLLLALAELVYTLAVYLGGHPIEGWTTTMLVLTAGFAGLFALFAVALKYLCLILQFTFRKQNNLIEGIEKIQK